MMEPGALHIAHRPLTPLHGDCRQNQFRSMNAVRSLVQHITRNGKIQNRIFQMLPPPVPYPHKTVHPGALRHILPHNGSVVYLHGLLCIGTVKPLQFFVGSHSRFQPPPLFFVKHHVLFQLSRTALLNLSVPLRLPLRHGFLQSRLFAGLQQAKPA